MWKHQRYRHLSATRQQTIKFRSKRRTYRATTKTASRLGTQSRLWRELCQQEPLKVLVKRLLMFSRIGCKGVTLGNTPMLWSIWRKYPSRSGIPIYKSWRSLILRRRVCQIIVVDLLRTKWKAICHKAQICPKKIGSPNWANLCWWPSSLASRFGERLGRHDPVYYPVRGPSLMMMILILIALGSQHRNEQLTRAGQSELWAYLYLRCYYWWNITHFCVEVYRRSVLSFQCAQVILFCPFFYQIVPSSHLQTGRFFLWTSILSRCPQDSKEWLLSSPIICAYRLHCPDQALHHKCTSERLKWPELSLFSENQTIGSSSSNSIDSLWSMQAGISVARRSIGDQIFVRFKVKLSAPQVEERMALYPPASACSALRHRSLPRRRV